MPKSPLPRSRLNAKRIHHLKRRVDAVLHRATIRYHGAENIATRALRYSLSTKGHRWRPLLFLLLIEAVEISNTESLEAAAGLESIHTGTLIIDDLPFVDNASVRRGKPCCHVRFGVEVAFYASHLAFDLGEGLILRNAPCVYRESLSEGLKTLKKTLVAGQCLERALENGGLRANLQNMRNQYYLKSGALFKFTTHLASRFSNLDKRHVAMLETFGEEIGIAYQIADDIADLAGKVSEIGKQTNMDADKINYPRILGKRAAITKLKQHHRNGVVALNKLYDQGALKRNKALILYVVDQLHKHY